MEYCDAEYPSEDEAAGDDGWMVIAPSWGVDGPQATWALLPCEIRWGFLDFLFQDDSDGEVCRPLSCHPGLHDHCHKMSSSMTRHCHLSMLIMMVAAAHTFLQRRLGP